MTSLHRLSLSHVTQEEGGRILTALSGYSLWYLLCVSPFASRSSHVQMTSPIYSQSGTLIAVSSQEGLVRVDPNPCSASRKRSDVTRKLRRLGVIDKSVHVDPVILDVPLEDFWIDSFERELWVVLTNRCTGSRHMCRPVYEK
ncbi:hypothetical protein JB92DRAFT_2832650 [Gautieria morchelliformis]|nr:hypothetical protein JB92DRAFT_2832650 [Gautieria morchelliformis]